MELLGFARGFGLKFALVIFFFGVTWRIFSLVLLRHGRDFNEPRAGFPRALLVGLLTTASRSWPHREFTKRTAAGEALGYSYHLGLFTIMGAFAPHVAFFRSTTGFTWPSLPTRLVTVVSVITLTLLLAVLFRRLNSRVMRLMSNFDDYFSWFVTAMTIVTGLAATANVGLRYETLLGLHILSVDLLLIWFPFGKLMHAFYIMPSRALNGYLLARKGAPT
jgi:nitrate reductase gamma subunit